MLRIELHPARLVRVKGGDWVQLMGTEFRLLSVLLAKANKLVTFREMQWQLWEFEERREGSALYATRQRLLSAVENSAREMEWDKILRRDPQRGYGLFLPEASSGGT